MVSVVGGVVVKFMRILYSIFPLNKSKWFTTTIAHIGLSTFAIVNASLTASYKHNVA